MQPTPIGKAVVIGTGMMGPGIGLVLALGGVDTTLVSRTTDGAARGKASVQAQAALLLRNQLVDQETVDAALGRITTSSALDSAVSDAGLVIESGPEDLVYKQTLFEQIDRIGPKTAILASNTSSLSITQIAAHCQHRGRIMTAHFWNPPLLVPLVEIVCGDDTEPGPAESLRTLLAACGKVPVMVRKDRPGQLGNRLQVAMIREAAYMIAEGIATAEDIDLAIQNGLGLRFPAYGLLTHQDNVGLDLTLAVNAYVSPDLYRDSEAPPYLKGLVARGDLGVKTGRGFFDWSNRNAEDAKAKRDQFLIDFLRSKRAGPGQRA
jgi:3-hydroxybutyryl-CoA dehydrogenase